LGTKVLPHKQTYQKGAGEVEEKIIYDKYDEYDNLLQYHIPGGHNTSFVWGYNNKFPVFKIDGVSYDDVVASLSRGQLILLKKGSKEDILNVSSALRANFPLSQITTYTYAPLVGVTSVTDPRGYTTYYEYDEFDRLKHIKDANLDVIEFFDYKYKDQ
jgi:YD repeat-containing protein